MRHFDKCPGVIVMNAPRIWRDGCPGPGGHTPRWGHHAQVCCELRARWKGMAGTPKTLQGRRHDPNTTSRRPGHYCNTTKALPGQYLEQYQDIHNTLREQYGAPDITRTLRPHEHNKHTTASWHGLEQYGNTHTTKTLQTPARYQDSTGARTLLKTIQGKNTTEPLQGQY